MKAATIFIADDDEQFRRVLGRELVRLGYDVLTAPDGTAALEALSRAADGAVAVPDVIVLDVMMPGYSGLGILEAMRHFAVRPPTFIVTGFRDDSIHLLARRLGAARVFFKPVDLDELMEGILQAAQPPPPAPAPSSSPARPRRG